MVESFPPSDETKRLQALQSLKVLDAQPDARFERIIRLARRLFDVPLAAVLLADRGGSAPQHRELLEVFESAHRRAAGNGATHDVFVVPDTANDPRFRRRALLLDDGTVRFFAGCAVHASHGARVGTLCLVDIVPRTLGAEELQLLAELGGMISEELSSLSIATSDTLTKVTNRRGFEHIASHILPMAKRLRLPVALVHIDLDGFKGINDSRGHEAGDRVLAAFARHLLKNFRESDVVARLGGDEFCVLMSGAPEATVMETLRRLAARLEQCAAEPIRFSAGIAMFDPDRHAGIDDLLREADRRMYESKRRNRAQRRRRSRS
jgi:diguanylate cyclase (GGDEF)-like protein